LGVRLSSSLGTWRDRAFRMETGRALAIEAPLNRHFT
jgi:hypothetical protein